MARAKRTERAEARRRFRALQVEAVEDAGTEDAASTGARPASARGPRTDPKTAPVPGQRYGFMQSFRLAYRPIQYRGDLRYIPTLIFRTNAIWPAALLVLVASAILGIEKDATTMQAQLALAVLGNGVPFIPAVIAGFLAPRAAWIAGAMVTLLGLLVPLVVIRDRLGTVHWDAGLVLQAIIASLVYGAAFGAASAWYKRFLSFLMSSSTGRGGSGRGSQSKPAGRGSKPAVAGRRRAS